MRSRPEGRIAANLEVARFVDTHREIVDVANTDSTDVSAVVLAAEDLSNGIVSRLEETGFDLPVFVVTRPEENVDLDVQGVTGVLASEDHNAEFFGRMVETSASKYDEAVLPPFFGAPSRYERRGTRRLIARAIRAASSSCAIPPGGGWWSSSERTFSEPTCATRT